MTWKDSFLWGGAISANQTEGHFNADGRGLTNFDILPMEPKRLDDVYLDQDNIINQSYHFYSGRHGNNFYETYESDIELLAELGVNSFRLSVAWSRIFPTGEEESPNERGLQFYENIFKKLKEKKIEPIVTISHFDMPLYLIKKYGGWFSRKVVDLYVNYATVVMKRFSDYVQYWIPFNEMNMIMHIPFIGAGLTFTKNENKLAKKYQATHHQLLANAKVIQIGRQINSNFKFGCMMAAAKTYPYTCKPEDVFSAFESDKYNLIFSDVQVKGKYPNFLATFFEKNQIHLQTEQEDFEILKNNTVDFLSFSYYSSACSVAKDSDVEKVKTNGPDTVKNPYLPASNSVWQVDPLGLRITLNQLYDRYELPLFIVENGLGTYDDQFVDGRIHDDYRVNYLKEHLKNMVLAVEEDGVELIGYLMWGIIDLVSVSEGKMSKRYGLIYVDADDQGHGTYKRYRKDSFYWYQKVVESNGDYLFD
ncbi:glycoside hydrolase family 1 protein [Amphibacillus sediminis]|uniref:glycoside hydrolase family 1 protein n=1 Tax=Amphibacillus sediminis TaxID=360185 RepID=UPI00082F444F|nr:family 1 glycosylhydrolase [Amphibacillus sediminis]